jgi:hypothetical protein
MSWLKWLTNWLFPPYVFCSYSRTDKEFADGIGIELIKRRFEVFIDRWEITGPWLPRIDRALKDCDAGLVILTPEAVGSSSVLREVDVLVQRASDGKIFFVPVLYHDTEVPAKVAEYQWVDFRGSDTYKRNRAIRDLVRGLQGLPPGPPDGVALPQKRRATPRVFGLCAFLLFALLLTVKGASSFVYSKKTLQDLGKTQTSIQQIEENMGGLAAGQIQEGENRQYRVYSDPRGIPVVKDEWSAGRLIRRDFYKAGSLIARDEFTYSNGTPVEKHRSYLDADQRVFLYDEFTQDGVLRQKRYCPDGKTDACVNWIVEMRSPLPPTWLILYR